MRLRQPAGTQWQLLKSVKGHNNHNIIYCNINRTKTTRETGKSKIFLTSPAAGSAPAPNLLGKYN